MERKYVHRQEKETYAKVMQEIVASMNIGINRE